MEDEADGFCFYLACFKETITHQVIQTVTFLFPNVGGHF